MCGVVGLINLNGDAVSPVILKKMTDAIAHRGPDGEGHWIEVNVGLGHLRLAIIDPSPAGHQPMISADHRWVLSYNGEIYNYRELRAEMEADGVWFHSKTDSEVVLNALARWGTEALLKFNGMFALALWDRKEKTLLLARDRYGIKPLYYSNQSGRFAFGSEQKAIIAQPTFRRVLNKPALLEYFSFQNIFSDQTLLQDINILPAGYFLTLSHEEFARPKLHRYWDFCFCELETPLQREEYIEELDRLFKQAVNRQLISDVELGVYLSGGVDSGSITAIAADSFSNLKTFTCGFDLSSASGIELAFDERAKAEFMSARFRTEHYEMVLKAGDMERSLPLLARHLEEPRVGQSYPNYYAAKLTSKFVKVVLSGVGGDELFGGYPWRYSRVENCANLDQFIDQYYLYWQRLVDNKNLKSIFAPIWGDVDCVSTREIFSKVLDPHCQDLDRPEDYINHALYFEAKTFLHGLFVVEDKLSMAHSLESRLPFMDNDLVDFAMRCPVGLKINCSYDSSSRISEDLSDHNKICFIEKTCDGKQVFRDMIKKYIPVDIAECAKQGFSSPDASWFRGESIDFVRRKLLNSDSAIYSLLDKNTIATLLEEHFSGRNNRRLLIWSLLYLSQYLEEFLP
jgi:asparagine synthase (glutamine-hydrolysing)